MNRLLLCLLCCLAAHALTAQNVVPVQLKLKQIGAAPKHFYIASVKDDRADTGTIGRIRINNTGPQVSINPQQGAAAAIAALLPDIHARHATPVEMHITQLKISETVKGRTEDVSDSAGFAFYRNGIKLVEFAGSFRMTTNTGAFNYLDQLISEPVAGALNRLDGWWAEHKAQLDAPPSVTVTVMTGMPEEKHLVAYDAGRPLQLSDFRGTPDEESPGDAATSSGIHVSYDIRSEYGSIAVHVTVTPVFDRNESWVKKEGRNRETLQHEQLHFDITAIKACRYIALVKAHHFSFDNYTAELDAVYKQVQQEWENMEDDYDNETSHGQLQQAQRVWELKIHNLLQDGGCLR